MNLGGKELYVPSLNRDCRSTPSMPFTILRISNQPGATISDPTRAQLFPEMVAAG
jgi:hypothetical protein